MKNSIKTLVPFIIWASMGCSAESKLDVSIEEVFIKNNEYHAQVRFSNSENSKYTIYGRNLCSSSGEMYKHLFIILHPLNNKTLPFRGVLLGAQFSDVNISPRESTTCIYNLTRNYGLTTSSELEFSIQYSALNPKYQQQNTETLESEKVIINPNKVIRK